MGTVFPGLPGWQLDRDPLVPQPGYAVGLVLAESLEDKHIPLQVKEIAALGSFSYFIQLISTMALHLPLVSLKINSGSELRVGIRNPGLNLYAALCGS